MVSQNEYNPYYKTYIDISLKVPIVVGLTKNLQTVVEFFKDMPSEKQDYAYTEGKWTPKDILQHLIDTERIFTYRALRIARGDNTPLSGFEQDDYVPMAVANERDIHSLTAEYQAVRHASISLYKSFSPEDLIRKGIASDSLISVRAIGYILTGHENHHINIIRERYL